MAEPIRECVNGNFQRRMCRIRGAPILGMNLRGFAHKHEVVLQPCRPVRIPDRSSDNFATGIGECDQMSREIAAIHRRDVFRIESTQVTCFVPIVEMTTKTLHSVHCRERRLDALQRCERSQPAEIARCDH